MTENKLFEALLDILPFSAYAVDVNSFEVVYANKLMSEHMYAPRKESCWEKIYGQEEACSWCSIPELKKRSAIYTNDKLATTFFDESTDKWFQSFDEIVKWPDGRDVRYSIAVDITEQKEIQASMIKTHTKLAIKTKQLQEANEKLEYMATKDYLTGVNNRRSFFNFGNQVIDLKLGLNEFIYVAVLDLDKFKQINDNHGHKAGDLVLKEFTSKVEEKLDKNDIFGRLGGEEFAIIGIAKDKEKVIEKLESIRKTVEQTVIENENKKISFTVSIGLALRNSDENLDALLENADQELYGAKAAGRNRLKVRL